jgi:SP family myo-inositol transporter-like MFS transporter 13
MRQSFEKSNLATVFPDSTHLEINDDEMGRNTIDDLGTSWFVWLVAATASIAGSLFGYDTGIISAVLVYLNNDLNNRPVSSGEKELITSLCSGGAFIGAIIAGLTADQVSRPRKYSPISKRHLLTVLQFGRKVAIYVGCALFTIGAILQAAAYTIAQMSVGRLIVGFGVGSAAMVVPLYIAEIAPTKVRGRLIGLNNMSITGGQGKYIPLSYLSASSLRLSTLSRQLWPGSRLRTCPTWLAVHGRSWGSSGYPSGLFVAILSGKFLQPIQIISSKQHH